MTDQKFPRELPGGLTLTGIHDLTPDIDRWRAILRARAEATGFEHAIIDIERDGENKSHPRFTLCWPTGDERALANLVVEMFGHTLALVQEQQAKARASEPANVSQAARDAIAERARQDAKWGELNHDPFVYLAILHEESGELAQAALKARFEDQAEGARERMRAEAVQVAAVALAIVECLDRGKWTWGGHALTGKASRAEAVRAVAAAAGVDPVQAAHNAAIDCQRPSCSWCRPEKGEA
jgi:NTP pyrophosphatase (non-canonical NTP hydrolase)